MNFKQVIKKIHRWLGFTSGIIVFIVSISGCIFCFHDEIKDATRSWRKVDYQNKNYINPTILLEKAKEKIPEGIPVITVYSGRNRSSFVYVTTKDNYFNVYFNPYSGDYLQTENLKEDFFIMIQYLHMYLLLPPEIGKHIVGIATIIFIIMVISGIIIWWPKNKNAKRQRFFFLWGKATQWKRKNYDLHNILGFYIAIIAIVMAISGLNFSYEWVKDSIYYTANLGGNIEKETYMPVIDTTFYKRNPAPQAIDIAFSETLKKQPKAAMFFVKASYDKSQAILTGAYEHSLRYDHQSNYYFHPSSGKLIKSEPNDEKSIGIQLVEMSYGIHTGQILNLPGKIIAFFVSLIASSLPVTGFMIWWGRKKKFKKTKNCFPTRF